jgi:hypothetical protein
MKAANKLSIFLLLFSLVFTIDFGIMHNQTVKAQGQNTPIASTVWREYPYISPHLVQNDTHYIYVTDWGNYSFSKALPYVCMYTFRNGKAMVSFSTFWINTTNMLVPLNTPWS